MTERNGKLKSALGLPFDLGGKINQNIKNRLIEAMVDGFGTLFMSEELVGRIMDELRLPREWLTQIAAQTEKARKGVADVMKSEVRRFLEGIDLQQELANILSSMVLEVKTEIRFVQAKDGKLQQKKKSRFSFRRNGNEEQVQ
jgi:hypothetical protein